MDYTIGNRDALRTEVEYRLNRAKADLAGRRKRRILTRYGDDGLTWNKVR